MAVTDDLNHEVVLVGRPDPAVTADLFDVREAPMPEPGEGWLLVRVLLLSLDPAMRGWIVDAPNYREPVALGAVMPGFTVGEVAASRHPDYQVGDIVVGSQGWREWALSDGSDIDRKASGEDADLGPHLHVLGINGITAYLGLLEVGCPRAGETVVVSTAAGAVGSMVGQIAKIKGCRTVGLTSTDAKVAHCRTLFGYDAVINYKTSQDLSAAVAEACPEGVDVYFDNTAGPISDAVMAHLNVGARIVVCGTAGMGASPEGPRYNRQLLVKRARMEGFLYFDHLERRGEALKDLQHWLEEGRLAYLEDVTNDIENAPATLCRLLQGENEGKTLIRVGAAPEPEAP
jgi:NADPH-dependent curcumin reductase CurA